MGGKKQQTTYYIVYGVLLALQCYCWSAVHGQNAMSRPLEYSMLEESAPGVMLGDVINDASMTSSGSRKTTARLLPSGIHAKYFVLDGSLLKTSDVSLDRDIICLGQDTCIAELDILLLRGLEQRFVKAQIEVVDINDNWPRFAMTVFELTVSESAPVGTSLTLPLATDPDSPHNGVARYEMSGEEVSGVFRLKASTLPPSYGTISHVISTDEELVNELSLVVDGELDYERRTTYDINVTAWDAAGRRGDTLMVRVRVQDENDNRPHFLNDSYVVSIPENTPPSTTVAVMQAVDSDAGDGEKLRYSFSTSTATLHGSVFAIDQTTGAVTLRTTLDHEEVRQYSLTVVARDAGTPPLTAQVRLTVHVLDVNDNAPAIVVNAASMSGRLEVPENGPADTVAAFITVSDPDSGDAGQVECTLQSDGNFALQPAPFAKMYSIVGVQTFDRERRNTYDVIVRCADAGVPSLWTAQSVTITVRDENDNPPVFRQNQITSVTVAENNAPDATLLIVTASDADEGANAAISYTVDSRVSHLVRVIPTSGRITAMTSFDRELHDDVITFYVYATDGGSPHMSASILVTITIEDTNDEAPIFANTPYTFAVYENGNAGVSIGNVTAIDRDQSPNNDFLFSLVDPDGAFDIDPVTGYITALRPLDREEKAVYHVMVYATNTAPPMPSSSTNISIYVIDRNDNKPIVMQPNDTTNTIQLSAFAKAKHVVSRLHARDMDSGENGRLTYVIEDGNSDDLFDVLPSKGEVYLKKNLWDYRRQRYHVTMRVYDAGTPPLWSRVTLHIVANESMPVVRDDVSGDVNVTSSGGDDGLQFPKLLMLGKHEFVIVMLAAATLVVILCLVTAILCVVKQRRRRDSSKHSLYKCQCTATSDMAQRLYPDSSTQSSCHSLKRQCPDPACLRHSALHQLPQTQSSDTMDGSVAFSVMDHTDRLMAHKAALAGGMRDRGDLMTSRHDFIGGGGCDDSSPFSESAVDSHLHLHEHLLASKAECDNDSLSGDSSVAGSNDSGRGTSLDGAVQQAVTGRQFLLSHLSSELPIITEVSPAAVYCLQQPRNDVTCRHTHALLPARRFPYPPIQLVPAPVVSSAQYSELEIHQQQQQYHQHRCGNSGNQLQQSPRTTTTLISRHSPASVYPSTNNDLKPAVVDNSSATLTRQSSASCQPTQQHNHRVRWQQDVTCARQDGGVREDEGDAICDNSPPPPSQLLAIRPGTQS